MNAENILKAIAVMERARECDSLDMRDWQTYGNGHVSRTEEVFHECGNTACFAGHIGISPEFQADGGYVNYFGIPSISSNVNRSYNESTGTSAISEWLGISYKLARSFVHGDVEDDETLMRFSHSKFYGKNGHLLMLMMSLRS